MLVNPKDENSSYLEIKAKRKKLCSFTWFKKVGQRDTNKYAFIVESRRNNRKTTFIYQANAQSSRLG